MRSREELRRDVLRMVTNAAYNLEKKEQRPLSDDEYLAVVTREVKTRRESVEAFRKVVGRSLRSARNPRSPSFPSSSPRRSPKTSSRLLLSRP